MKRFLFTSIFSLLIVTGFSQNEAGAKHIDSLIKLGSKNTGKGKIIQDKQSVSGAIYSFVRKKKILKWALLIYPKEKAITLYFHDNKLIKAKVQLYDHTNKSGDGGIYYFEQGSLIHKKETNIPTQDTDQIKVIAQECLAKSLNLYPD